MLTWRRGATAAVASLALLLSLGACGDGDATLRTEGGTLKVDRDGGEITIEGSDGSSARTSAGLPADFPGEIPLVDGRVIQGVAVADAQGGGFSVSIETEGGLGDVFTDATELLEEAGFTSTTTQSVPDSLEMGGFEIDAWQVLVQVAPSGENGSVFVSYTVVSRSGS